MSENIIIAIITLSGSIIGAVIGAFATITAAQVKENPISSKPFSLKQKKWVSILFGAIVGGVGLLILGIVVFPFKNVCEQIKLTAIPNIIEIKQSATTPEWNNV